MAKRYVLDRRIRFINRLMRVMTRLGISGPTVMMTTRGRRSGEPRSVAVSPIEVAGTRYIVSPYGEVGWVRNVRADPSVELKRRSRTDRAKLVEVALDQAPPVLDQYYAREKITRPYFDVPAQPSRADFVAVVGSHPVFSVHQST